MTIEREGHYDHIVSCDFCSYTEDFEINFTQIVARIKEDGWQLRRNATNEWLHKCPSCIEKDNKQTASIADNMEDSL